MRFLTARHGLCRLPARALCIDGDECVETCPRDECLATQGRRLQRHRDPQGPIRINAGLILRPTFLKGVGSTGHLRRFTVMRTHTE